MVHRGTQGFSSTDRFGAKDDVDPVMSSVAFYGAPAGGAMRRDFDTVADAILHGISRYAGPTLLVGTVAVLGVLIL